MTVQSDLKTALDAYIQANFAGTLPAISAENLNLEQLLKILETVTPVTLSGDVTIDNVAITSSVLPTGASTSALQTDGNASLESIDTKASSLALESGGVLDEISSKVALESGGNLADINSKLPSSLGSKASTNSISQANSQAQTTLTQLTAPSSTAAVSMTGYTRAFITLTVASIDTNVVVRIEGSNDGSNWTNLSTANTDTTITANGTYGFVFVGCPASVRVTFVSESGGTAATIDAIVRVSS